MPLRRHISSKHEPTLADRLFDAHQAIQAMGIKGNAERRCLRMFLDGWAPLVDSVSTGECFLTRGEGPWAEVALIRRSGNVEYL